MVQNFSCAPVASSLRRTFSHMHTCMLTCRNSVLGATPSTPLGFSWNLSLKCSDCFKTHLLPEAGDSVERCFGMLFTLGSVNIGEGRGKKNGALGTTSIFSPTCLPLQCWSSEVFIRGLNPRYFIPFRNYLEMSILLSVMFPSKIASERKPQELLVWPNVIAAENHWLNWSCFKILACFWIVPSIYSSPTEKWYTTRLLQTKWCKRISALFPSHFLGLKHPLTSPWPVTAPSSYRICWSHFVLCYLVWHRTVAHISNWEVWLRKTTSASLHSGLPPASSTGLSCLDFSGIPDTRKQSAVETWDMWKTSLVGDSSSLSVGDEWTSTMSWALPKHTGPWCCSLSPEPISPHCQVGHQVF